MKLKDIKVGEDYAVGTTDRHNLRATVLEVGMDGRVWDGWNYVMSRSPYLVRVRYINGGEGTVSPGMVLRPWSEQELINAEWDAKEQAADAERARIKRLHDHAEAMLTALEWVSVGARITVEQYAAIDAIIARVKGEAP